MFIEHVLTSVVTPATNSGLAALADARAELGLGTADDELLQSYIARASSAIVGYCNRPLAQTTYQDTFRLVHNRRTAAVGKVSPLALERWPLVSVTSITETTNGIDTVLGASDHEADLETAFLYRLSTDDCPQAWTAPKIVVRYVAGFICPAGGVQPDDVDLPEDIQSECLRLVTTLYRTKGRDSAVRQESVGGVLEVQYASGSGMPGGALAISSGGPLDKYRVAAFA